MRRKLTAFLIVIAGAIVSVEFADAVGARGAAAYGVYIACGFVFVMSAVLVEAGGLGPRDPSERHLRRAPRRD